MTRIWLMAQQMANKIIVVFVLTMFFTPNPMFPKETPPLSTPTTGPTLTTRLEIHVSGGELATPVKKAEVFVKSEMSDEEFEETMKTNSQGNVIVLGVPRGRALIQVTAEGWNNYGRLHDLEQEIETITITLEREVEPTPTGP
ncbi:MAG: hypothetical protein L0Y68_01425 [Candidatus Dadabacteria bacterium]|nr:hypothetical protein [Candidatus Dadabacteria bacterium]